MKYFLLAILLLVLQGCATVEMTKNGDDITWTSRTLWKDIETVGAQAIAEKGNFTFDMGSSGSAMTPEEVVKLTCALNPSWCDL